MLNKFRHRSNQKELLDGINIPRELLFQNLKEFDLINHLLGGYAISLHGIRKLIMEKDRVYHITDLGCGSGGTMKHIALWARKKGYHVELTGIDKNPDAIDFVKKSCSDFPEIRCNVLDYRDYLNYQAPVDIIHSSLFCHHLDDAELSELIHAFNQRSLTGFVINDLHRNWLAYYGVKLITLAFKGSRLSRNDGPVSVLRAFKRSEWVALLEKEQIVRYSVQWKPLFRYLVIGYGNDN
jgi:SAM-dependent methyltransferase